MSQNTISILSFFLAYDVENLFFSHLASIYKIFTAELDVLFLYRGTDEHFGISDKIDIVNSTLGKALGGAAGRKWLSCFIETHLCIYVEYVSCNSRLIYG